MLSCACDCFFSLACVFSICFVSHKLGFRLQRFTLLSETLFLVLLYVPLLFPNQEEEADSVVGSRRFC